MGLMIEVGIDGAWRYWSGEITYGAIAREDDEVLFEDFEGEEIPLNRGSGNASEYLALRMALRWLKYLGKTGEKILVRSDSRMLVNQMSGLWRCKRGKYKPIYEECVQLAGKFDDLEFEWIPREDNTEAHDLADRGFEMLGVEEEIHELDKRFLRAAGIE